MIQRTLFLLFLAILNGQVLASHVFQILRQTKERVKHGTQCLAPSKYYAGSCYTYMKMSPAPSWERAHNNCLSLPMMNDANLLAIETIDEYEFIERELIGLKSGSESVSVYIGLRKVNNTWFWSNHVPLKETPVYRFWVDNNRDILAYDCGILWLARNTSVITPAPCVEQALRPYVCKQTIDRCYNRSGSCGKYGTCINLPLISSHRCQCRFLYAGDQCEKWSSQGLQMLIGATIIVFALIISWIINIDRSERSMASFDSTSDPLLHPSIRKEKPDTPRSPRRQFLRPDRCILIILSLTLTMLLCVLIVSARQYIKENMAQLNRLFQFCLLHEHNYYLNFVPLPIALVILLLLIVNQTRIERRRSLYIPIPFNPFSKVNRFDTMVLCGLISHEILAMIEELFLQTTSMRLLTSNGPLFDLIRQIGLIMIMGLRYYPVYAVMDLSDRHILYYGLCAFYMWVDFGLRVFEQIVCVNNSVLIRAWQKFQELQQETSRWMATTAISALDDDDEKKGYFHRMEDRLGFWRVKPSTSTPVIPSMQNWSSIYMNISAVSSPTDSQSTFDQFGMDASMINVLKYTPYYLCLIYICLRLTYLLFISIYQSVFCCDNQTTARKHVYHEPTFTARSPPTMEYHYVRDLFTRNTSVTHRRCSLIKSFFGRIYRPVKYFQYSKQILNVYMIASMLIYYLTFNILQTGFYVIEKLSSFILMPLSIVYDELDLPEPKPMNLKYEIVLACLFTALIYYGQLFLGLKNYQRHMLQAYRGINLDLPSRSTLSKGRYASKHIHYAGYFIAYLVCGYILVGNLLFLLLVTLRITLQHIVLLEDIAKVLIPIFVIYLVNFLIHSFLTRTCFLEKHATTITLKNQRFYFVFAYFNFFFDCCLGMVSCALRLGKASIMALLFLSRLEYSIFGRALERTDTSFIAYASFVHLECRHTHPVLVYFCSLLHEQNAREARLSKRDLHAYRHHQQIVFRWWLAITLSRNRRLIRWRKHQLHQVTWLSRVQSNHRSMSRSGEFLDSSVTFRNHTTTCTTLLLDMDECDVRKGSF